jgi:hypothetical protein
MEGVGLHRAVINAHLVINKLKKAKTNAVVELFKE